MISQVTESAPWSVRALSVVKPGNDSYLSGGQSVARANEDRWRVDADDRRVIAAVADGAGSSGLFCGAWAETLVGHLPDTPLSDLAELDQWLGGLSDAFHHRQLARLVPQSVHRTKFIREGSYATLMVCWLTCQQRRLSLHWLGYGDSMMLVFQRQDGLFTLQQVCPSDLAGLDRSPHLLNWKDIPLAQGLVTGGMDLPASAVVVLASDALGQYLLLRYLASWDGRDSVWREHLLAQVENGQGKLADLARMHLAAAPYRWSDEWGRITAALQSEGDFATWVQSTYDRGELANDDSTLVVIDIELADEQIVENEEGDTDGFAESDGL